MAMFANIQGPAQVQLDQWELFLSWMHNPSDDSQQPLASRLGGAWVTLSYLQVCLCRWEGNFTTSSTWRCTLLLYALLNGQINNGAGSKDPKVYISPFHVTHHIILCAHKRQPAPLTFRHP